MPNAPSLERKTSIAAVASALFVALVLPRSVPAQSSKPAKKDSIARTKPKDVVLTPTATPAEVRPGDTVVYKVAAKLAPGWHIYTYTRETQDEGPRKTRFDLFDAGPLRVAGDWSASREPLRKKEPAFPDIDSIAFYEDEVSWSIRLKVPDDAAPGKATLRCQASYQICNAKSCSFPGAWTLPDVVVTVLGDRQASAPQAAIPQPKKQDGDEKFKPKPVALSAAIKPATARPGETVNYSVTAKLEPGWHIYDYAKEPAAEGPQATRFDLFDTTGLTVAGEWTASTAPQVKQDEAFNVPVSMFEGEVTWTLPLKAPADLSPGEKTLRCQVEYQVCNDKVCLPPYRWTLPAVTLNVPAGGAVVASASEAPRLEPAPPVRVEKTEKARAVSNVEKSAQKGIIPLMIASALGGLLALVMPCVWPMVPITVNFFVKQGQSKKGGGTTALAVTYCLAIIGVFTAVGVLCSFFVSATALPRLANNPWLNFAVAGLFFAFGLSLLGLFEISLPSALLNASAKNEGRGGLVGVVFMALTLTITSFTCTFPVVGGLLVIASKGEFFYPIVGLATFSAVLALPFFLLALSPGLLSKMPRSGDWMNSVKVVGGLVEIAAAFKFLNTAELAFVTPEEAWINAPFILTAWVVLSAVCGFYLLGFFRTDHDHEEVKVGPGRMILGTAFLGFALFLAPSLFGRPPQNPVWSRLVVGLLPPDASKLSSGGGAASVAKGEAPGDEDVFATSTDPKQAEREEKRFHGVLWGFSYDAAVEKAKAEGKPILIDFTGVNCTNCRMMEISVMPRPEVAKLLNEFVTVQLYTPPNVPIKSLTRAQREALSEQNTERQIKLVNEPTNPFYVVLSPDEDVIATQAGGSEPGAFVEFLTGALAKHQGGGNKVAQAGANR